MPSFSLSQIELSRRAATARPAIGEHAAQLANITFGDKPTGAWVHLTYTLDGTDHRVPLHLLVEPASNRPDLAGMSLEHLTLLLAAISATLAVDSVNDVSAALVDMMGRPVRVVIKHRVEAALGTTTAAISGFRPAAATPVGTVGKGHN